MRDDEGDAGRPRELAREEQPRHRERRIVQAADRVQGIVPVQPLVAVDVHRMKEDRRAARRGDLPERVSARMKAASPMIGGQDPGDEPGLL
jgi:hypothetical protein